ncbi:MAG: tetratricopeptide repeat protein [Fibrobacterota bacterium]
MKHPILLLLLLLPLTSCVYFNTFYNARKYFDQARETQQRRLAAQQADTVKKVDDAEKKLFDKAIEKCSKVLKLYPQNKKYVPLSTLLLAEIYFWEAEYPSAIRKCNEFIAHYPEHPEFYRAVYFKGMSYYGDQAYEKAQLEFERILDGKAAGDYRKKARYMLAEISVVRGSSFGAMDQLQQLEGGGKILNSLISFKMGQLLFRQKEYAEALKKFEQVEDVKADKSLPEVNIPENLKYNAELMSGLCLREMGQPAKGVAHFEKMIENDRYYRFFGDIYNQIAACRALEKKSDEAKKIYERVVSEYAKTRAAAVACYSLGLLYESAFSDLRTAFKWYKRAQEEMAGCDEAKLAKERYEGLRAVMFLTANLDSLVLSDSLYRKEDSLTVDSIRKMPLSGRHFRAAEIYLYGLSTADSALYHFQQILAISPEADTSAGLKAVQMKALFASAWISANLLNRAAGSDSLFREVLRLYPATEYAKGAERALGLAVTQRTHSDSVNLRFWQAESLFYGQNDCAAAVAAFEKFYADYPLEPFASKALFSAAWISEDCLTDNPGAEKRYRLVLDSFPETDYGRFARRKLEGKKEGLKNIDAVGAEGTTLTSEMEYKIEKAGTTTERARESGDEGAWVTLASLTAVDGKLEGPARAQDTIKRELQAAVNAVDETYIDMVDDNLTQEGDLIVRLWLSPAGEVTKVKTETVAKGISDKTLIEEVQAIFQGLEFKEAKEACALEVKLTFKNKSKALPDE